MQAGMLKCPGCGAAAAPDAVSCSYCHTPLATVACASCYGMIFRGASHCSHCGAKVLAPAATETTARRCPRCRVAMGAAAVGDAMLDECATCGGVWVDADSFKRICESREIQAAAICLGSPMPAPAKAAPGAHAVQYVPCPECQELMNRVNFARCSGVIVDVCRGHGTWFDRDELRQIVDFIRAGGLDAARQKEIEQLTDARRQLAEERRGAEAADRPASLDPGYDSVVSAAGQLLKFLVG